MRNETGFGAIPRVGFEFPDYFVFFHMEAHHMSRVVTPSTTSPGANATMVPTDKIAMRAYEKWCKRGRPPGSDKQDWYEAEAELRAEYSKHSPMPARR